LVAWEELDGGWAGVVDAGWLVALFDPVLVAALAFDGAWAGAVPADGVEFAGDLGVDVG
jgi:hypothetical protein